MKLKYRLLLILILVGLVPSGIIGLSSTYMADKALEEETISKLSALREVKAASVTRYVNTIRGQVLSISTSPEVKRAVKGLSAGYAEVGKKLTASRTSRADLSEAKQNLVTGYFEPHFLSKFSPERAAGAPSRVVERLSPTAVALQTDYILNNPHPVGGKLDLVQGESGNLYDEEHGKIHPYLREFLEQFGFYDVFITDTDGEVIYSVYKEVDYATSLRDGPFYESGLAKAFQQGLTLAKGKPAVLVDFEPYMPSYDAPAGFISSPIYEGDTLLGVLIAQFPLDAFNQIMTDRTGLGETGETYLVGADGRMRSDSPLNDDFSVISSFEEDNKLLAPAIQNGLAGKVGSIRGVNYAGEEVISSYSPLKIAGLSWAIVSEVSPTEAFKHIDKLHVNIFIVLVLSTVMVCFVAFWTARQVSRPLGGEPKEMEAIANAIAKGDLTLEFSHTGKETGVYKAMAEMTEGLRRVVGKISQAAMQQAQAAEHLAQITQQTSLTIKNQNESTDRVAAAISQMSTTVTDVSQSTIAAASSSGEARDQVQTSVSEVVSSAEDVRNMSAALQGTNTKIETLQKAAADISGILSVIERIAEQTNLLALNAAIEAARAGEQGRGFAVVADEVRGLAQNTQSATADIATMISSLQKESTEAAEVMRQSVSKAKKVSDNSAKTTEKLESAVISVERIADMTAQVSTAAEQQSAVADEISHSIHEINTMAGEAGGAVGQISVASEELARLSSSLQRLVGTFTLK